MSDVIGIDVVFPIGSMDWIPYLRNACRFVRMQKYKQEKVGIIISYLYNKDEPMEQLAKTCRDYDAILVITKGSQKNAFETPLARNAGARRACREMVAFIDCDVALHPVTFSVSATHLAQKNVGVVIPVADMEYTPDAEIYQSNDEHFLEAEVQRVGRGRGDAMGAIIVPREAVFKIRGYDEQMYGWGADDTDFGMRIQRSGIAMIGLSKHGCPFALHQKHNTSSRESSFTARNRSILATSGNIIRNEISWGNISD